MAAAAEAAEGHRAAPSLHSTAGSAAAPQMESATSTMRSLPTMKASKSTENKIQDSARRSEDCERKHLNSIGKQVTSSRATQPNYSFGPAVFPACPATVPFRPVLPSHEDLKRLAELRVRTSNDSASFEVRPRTTPGPDLVVSFPPSPTPVLKGWGMEPRFQGGPRVSQARTSHNPVTAIVHSTQASPFSQTYPYQEIRMATRQLEEDLPHEDSDQRPSRLDPLNHSSTGVIARWEIRYPKKPSWSFGSSGLGSRFRKGTKFSRPAMVPTTCARVFNWRELRDDPGKMSPKNGLYLPSDD